MSDVGPAALPDDYVEAFADAYREAALADADMAEVARLLVSLRKELETADHFLDASESIDDLVGGAWARPELDSFRHLRRRLLDGYGHAEKERLEHGAFANAQDRWDEYVRSFARGVSSWELEACAAVAEADVGDAGEQRSVELLRRGAGYLVQERWAECYPTFELLAGSEAAARRDRGRITALCAAVQVYFFEGRDKALELLHRAEELVPDDSMTFEIRGDLYLEDNQLDAAKRELDKAMSLNPMSSGALASMGDHASKSGAVESAESWYREAIRRRPGSSTGYTRMCQLLGSLEISDEKAAEIPELVERAASVDPIGTYSIYLAAGAAYQARDDTDAAREWFERALELDPQRPGAHASLGHLLLGTGDVEGARAAFQRAIDVAEESLEGYWGMALLEEQENNWVEAERRFRQSLVARPQWRGIIAGRLAYAAFRQGKQQEAVDEILAALRQEPDNVTLRTLAERIADETESELGDLQGAIDVYGKIAGVLGEGEYGPRHQERLRNLNVSAALRSNRKANELYSAARYAESIPLYERAIELDPDDPVYHSNLSSAWELNVEVEAEARLARAIGHLERAAELAPEEDDYRSRLARLRDLLECVPVLGDGISRLPLVTPIAVEVASDLVPMIEGEGEGLSDLAQELVEAMRTRLLANFGVKVPGIRVRAMDDESDVGAFVILLMEVPTGAGTISDISRDEAADTYERRALERMMGTLESALEQRLGSFLGVEALDNLLTEEAPEWRERLRGVAGELACLEGVLRAMLAERVTIQPIASLCERYHELREEGVSLGEIVEHLRSLPEVIDKLPGNDEGRVFYKVSEEFLGVFERSINRDDGDPILAMTPEDCQQALTAVRNAIGGERPESLLIHREPLRPFVRRLLELEFPLLPVLSTEELVSEEPTIVATIAMEAESLKAGAAAEAESRAAADDAAQMGNL